MPEREQPTGEVGSEGGSPGNVETAERDAATHGSERTRTIDRVQHDEDTIVRDETGIEGRRSPTGPEQG
ncbi:MAG TPA: hypothetical protein VFA27_11985 [Vicinamibacterales bacterium]|nr:hypothetical protein [Vicinamibacterales bacterium]